MPLYRFVVALTLWLSAGAYAWPCLAYADQLPIDWQPVADLRLNTAVRIDLMDGSTVKGLTIAADAGGLTIFAQHRRRTLDRNEIRRIVLNTNKARDYAVRGALIGGGLGALVAVLARSSSAGFTAWQVIGNGAAGAVIGLLAGRGHRAETTIYEIRPPSPLRAS